MFSAAWRIFSRSTGNAFQQSPCPTRQAGGHCRIRGIFPCRSSSRNTVMPRATRVRISSPQAWSQGAEQTLSPSGTSAQSAAFNAQTSFVMVHAQEAACLNGAPTRPRDHRAAHGGRRNTVLRSATGKAFKVAAILGFEMGWPDASDPGVGTVTVVTSARRSSARVLGPAHCRPADVYRRRGTATDPGSGPRISGQDVGVILAGIAAIATDRDYRKSRNRPWPSHKQSAPASSRSL